MTSVTCRLIPKRRPDGGFTLVELIVTVAIVGILTMIALPSYSENVARSRRTDAKATLLLAAQWMERLRAENNGVYPTSVTLPSGLGTSPTTGAVLYDLTSASTTTTYTLSATPRTDGPMASDACGVFSVTHDGQRTAATVTSGSLFERCWAR